MKRTTILLIFIACTSTGCSYLEARGDDFLDCFRGAVGAGLGASLNVQAGPLATGLGYFDGYEAGLFGRCREHAWITRSGGTILFSGEGNETLSSKKSLPGKFCILVVYFRDVESMFLGPLENKWQNYFWVELNLKIFVGFRIGFNPAEFADFLLGWFGLDLCLDDKEYTRPCA